MVQLPASSLSDVSLLYFDSNGERVEVSLERAVNLDLLNIKHFRSLLSEYFKHNDKHFTYLVIKPSSDEIKPLL